MSAQYSVTPPPVVQELQAIFDALPDDELLAQLKGDSSKLGRPKYPPDILWRCYVTYYSLGLDSISALLRLLQDNPFIAGVCGIPDAGSMPSQPTMSRFVAKLAHRRFIVTLRNVQRALTQILYETLPGFGKSVAIDSTHMKGWSNANKKGKPRQGSVQRQRPKIGKVSDPDAGWCVKQNTHGKNESTFGYKTHLLVDAMYELPIAVDVTAGNVHDVNMAAPLLRQARFAHTFTPDFVLCDAGYSSEKLQRVIQRQYKATPIIDPNPTHKKAIIRKEAIPDWKKLYADRASVERVNARMKGHFKLDAVRVRSRKKVRSHAFMSAIALLGRAVAFPDRPRHCVRSVAGSEANHFE